MVRRSSLDSPAGTLSRSSSKPSGSGGGGSSSVLSGSVPQLSTPVKPASAVAVKEYGGIVRGSGSSSVGRAVSYGGVVGSVGSSPKIETPLGVERASVASVPVKEYGGTIKTQKRAVKTPFSYLVEGYNSLMRRAYPEPLRKEVTVTRSDVADVAAVGITAATIISPIPADEALAIGLTGGRGAKYVKPVVDLVKGGAQAVIGARAGTAVTREVVKGTAPAEEKALFGEVGGVVSKARGAERAALSEKGLAQQIGAEIPLVPLFTGSSKDFESALRAELKAQGFSGSALEKRVKAGTRLRTAQESGYAGGALMAGATAERLGQKYLSETFAKGGMAASKNIGWETFKRTAPAIAKAGFAEGVGTEFARAQVRDERVSLKAVAFGGSVGALTAGAIGGAIGATAFKRPIVSKVIEYGAYIIDPYEKPSDVLAAGFKGVSRRAGVVTPPAPVIIDTRAGKKGSMPFSFATVKDQGKRTKGRNSIVPSMVITPNINIPTFTNVPFTTPSITPSTTLESILTVPPSVPSNVPTDTPTETQQTEETRSNIPANIPASIPSMITIPSITPMPRVPPPLPLTFGTGAGGVGFGKGKRRRYVNELEEAKKILRRML